MTGTSLASLSRPLWRLLESYQIAPEYVFRDVGLDPKLMFESRARYDATQVHAAWAKASDLIQDPCFGLRVASFWSATDLHALGYAFLASSTLRTALQRLVRYVYVVDNVVGFDIEDDGKYLSLTLIMDNHFFASAEEDATWAFAISLCRTGYNETLKPAKVLLRHQKPACQAEYHNLFRCTVHFNAKKSAIMFTRSDVDQPLPAPNRELARMNDQVLVNYLTHLSENDFINRVKAAIADEMTSGTPRGEKIANMFHLSMRSLHRRLATEGATYSSLLDAVRQELAEQYIADPARSLNEITFLLGFSETSAFSRAFKRWTGQTPGKYREAMSVY